MPPPDTRRTGPGATGRGSVELVKEHPEDRRPPLWPQARVTSQELRRLRRQRAVECAHRLGARAVFELLDELARCYPEIADDLDRRLAAYAERLNPDLLQAIDGDRFSV